MAQPPTGYRTPPLKDQTEGIMDEGNEAARDVSDRAITLATDLGAAVKGRPYTTLAIAAGLAFTVGALWKMGHQRPQSRLQSLFAQLPELPSRESMMPRRWR